MSDTPKIDLSDHRIRTLNAMELAFSDEAMRAVVMVLEVSKQIQDTLPFPVASDEAGFLALMVRPVSDQKRAGAKSNSAHESAMGQITHHMATLSHYAEVFRTAQRGIEEVRRTKLGLLEAVDFESRTEWAAKLFEQADARFNTKPKD